MPQNGYTNGLPPPSPSRGRGVPNGNDFNEEIKPTYALEHLATFKVKHEAEIHNPKEKMKVLLELDKTGGIWPQKMYMCFNGQWLVMLDSEMKEIENFPGTLITEPTAFISDDPLETFNNILIFTVPGVSLGNTEMHIFQVTEVSAVHMVEDLKQLANGKIITVDRNKTPIRLPKQNKPPHQSRDQYGLAVAAAEVAAEKNAHDQEQTERDIQVLNHCFEDIERFIARLQYAAEALRELEHRKGEHNPHGEGLLVLRSRPPVETEFHDIMAKHKLALNYVVKLQNHFNNVGEALANIFISLETIVNVCNDVHVNEEIPQKVVNPLLKRETVTFLSSTLNVKDIDFWRSLGPNWTQPKDQFKDHRGSYHPIYYDDWSPDWVVDEEVAYLPPAIKKNLPPKSPKLVGNATWLARLQSRNVKIGEVAYDKTAHNDRELNVTKGEYLEIIDDSRNWWKARNSAGTIGYVPHTILIPHNFEQSSNYSGRDTDSIASSADADQNIILHNDNSHHNNNDNVAMHRHTLTPYVASIEEEQQIVPQPVLGKQVMPRSYSMPNVPVPPPMPPPEESLPNTPSGTMQRNMAAAGSIVAMRARNDFEPNDEALILQSTINDELRLTLMQRERRRDLEILTTPQIYITQHSKSREVEEWLRGKGFSDAIVGKLRALSGEELFALTPHVIESYFGQKESRRLISQIVLQKNICDYKTIRSSELSARLAKVRQKAEQQEKQQQKPIDPNEIF